MISLLLLVRSVTLVVRPSLCIPTRVIPPPALISAALVCAALSCPHALVCLCAPVCLCALVRLCALRCAHAFSCAPVSRGLDACIIQVLLLLLCWVGVTVQGLVVAAAAKGTARQRIGTR